MVRQALKDSITEVAASHAAPGESIIDDWENFKENVGRVVEAKVTVKWVGGIKKKTTPYCNDEMKAAVTAKHKAFRQWRRRRTPENRRLYEITRNETKITRCRVVRETWERLGQELRLDLSGNRKVIYLLAKEYRSKVNKGITR